MSHGKTDDSLFTTCWYLISSPSPRVPILGQWQAAVEVPRDTSLEKCVRYLEG
jgi:hypothetical protein